VDLPDDYTYEDFQGKNDSQYQKGIEVLKEKMKSARVYIENVYMETLDDTI